MSSPRKYASPYLTGIPGLPPSTNSSLGKPKKKSKNSITKLSESAAAVKQIQDGIWQSAKEARDFKTLSRSNSGDQSSPRKETSFDDASSCGGIAVENFLDDMKETCVSELTTSEDACGEPEKEIEEQQIPSEEDGAETEVTDATALVLSKDSVVLKKASMDSGTGEDHPQVCDKSPEVEGEEEEEPQASSQLHPPSSLPPSLELKSILKKPTVYAEKPKRETNNKKPNKSTSKSKYGRPVKESKDLLVPGPPGRVVNKLKVAQGSISNLEVHNKFNNNSNKTLAKSPRKKSKVGGALGSEQEKGQSQNATALVQGPRKSVRFSNKVDVHVVPYEPRAGSRACDWQRNMLEQRVQTFRQLMKEVGSAEDIDLFGNSMLFPGYPTYQSIPNPQFALRGTNAGLVGMPGMGRARNHYKM